MNVVHYENKSLFVRKYFLLVKKLMYIIRYEDAFVLTKHDVNLGACHFGDTNCHEKKFIWHPSISGPPEVAGRVL